MDHLHPLTLIAETVVGNNGEFEATPSAPPSSTASATRPTPTNGEPPPHQRTDLDGARVPGGSGLVYAVAAWQSCDGRSAQRKEESHESRLCRLAERWIAPRRPRSSFARLYVWSAQSFAKGPETASTGVRSRAACLTVGSVSGRRLADSAGSPGCRSREVGSAVTRGPPRIAPAPLPLAS
jgi:hypothetical protein